MLDSLLVLTIAVQPAPIPAPGAGSIVSTVWDMTVRGGWMMIPIAACSLLAMTIVVERFVITRRGRIVPPQFLESILALRHNPREALARCQADPSPLAAVILAAIKARHLSRGDQEKAIADAGGRELHKIRARMRLLSALPQTATMLGLLGTVIGMIRTFTVIAASGESLGKTERLAQGIHEAWTATAAGLIIAVPTLLAYHILMARIDSAAAALDNAASLWLDDETATRSSSQLTSENAAPEGRLAPAI